MADRICNTENDHYMKLKPIIFVKWKYGYNKQNTFQQTMLLQALKVTQDPKELKKMIGVKTVSDVYRTLDKLAMRKEYHQALADQWLTFDYIVEWIKKIAEDPCAKDTTKMDAYKVLLKSLGMDKYDDPQIASGNWEDMLLKDGDNLSKEANNIGEDYPVIEPDMPEELKEKKKLEIEEWKRLYE